MNNNYINKYTENYSNMKDEDLIRKIKSGDNDALDYILNKYQEVVNMKVSRYFIIGAEKEDIIQEGLIGLYKAIKSFDPEKQNSFKSFANLCIERQLITAIKSSNRQKHMPLNSYLSLNMSAYDNEDDDTSIYDIFDANIIEDPLDTITKKEYYKSVEDIIDKSLSIFEKNVLNELVNGSSYTAIAQKLDSPVKSVDNAIQRIRKKTMKNLNLEDKRKNNKS
ncbi:MAG TPA: RNA polymerase sporulation sigma factor SigH [Clostridiaceae bacterium]|jgi:RNA polymerase sporulation-specific sigma factor|nr:RNA polymerase sporulation sigma factor SigH [Clostridiaceae bacterium]